MIELFQRYTPEVKGAREISVLAGDEMAEKRLDIARQKREERAAEREKARKKARAQQRRRQIAMCQLRIKQLQERIDGENLAIARYRQEIE